jgi:phosphoribosylformylglycinamidine synthase
MVGVLDSLDHVTPSAFQVEGDAIVLLGDNTAELGASEYLLRLHGLAIGAPPACDPAAERRLIDALLEAIGHGLVRSAHDCSDGGLAVALAECAMMHRDRTTGFQVDLTDWADLPLRALLFGEAQGRVVVSTATPDALLEVAARIGVPARVIGRVTSAAEGVEFVIGAVSARSAIDPLAKAFHDTIPGIMDGGAPAEHAVATSHAPTTD